MRYETVMGLEVHTELSTKSKIFCGCTTEFGGEPNAHTCPVCLGMPGTLPVLNREAAEKALRAGLALNCEIQADNMFDRKNYFYPDLPKDYQISQLYHPICRNGSVEIDMGTYTKTVRIHEIHMEEDAGKLIHDGNVSLVDYNRCGVPLIEIVSEPDLRSADEVAAFLDKLREILVYLDVSDCKMEEGSMRADINLSVREEGSGALGTRTETKNMNSVKAIRRAIAYESERQIALVSAGGKVIQETRRWDDAAGVNRAMRNKENAQDYRYFPDPDLIPLSIDAAWIRRIKEALPELAEEKRARYARDWALPAKLTGILTEEREIADLFETIAAELGGDRHAAREAANTVTGDILRLLKETEGQKRVDGRKIATVLTLVQKKTINRNTGRAIIEAVFKDDVDPLAYIETHNLAMMRDGDLLTEAVLRALDENPQSVSDYASGKTKAFGFLVGQVMRALEGKCDPQAVNALLKEKLEAGGVAGALNAKVSEKGMPAPQSEHAVPQSEHAAPQSGNFSKKREPQVGECAKPPERNPARPILQPPAMSDRYRTHTCGALTERDIGATVKLAGWIHAIRNHGGIVFVDLRDCYGMTQVVVSDEQVRQLHREMTISVIGEVLKRDADTVNPKIETGWVELKAAAIETLGVCKNVLPFEVESSSDTKEELRLRYRYLDLRNPKVRAKIVLRAEVIRHLRATMDALGFLEIQTPILANSSPEGARDYLVPSRKHKGKFYALPQAPQQFKQLLMVSGFDRYYQIAPCFRDEDARLDRSPGEFYQLDFEMAFATQEDVFAVAESVMASTFKRFTDKPVTEPPFARIPYREAMLKYGTDKPDLRNPLEITDLTAFFAKVDFKPFQGNIVRAVAVPGAAAQPRSFFSSMEKFALSIGMKGLGYISVQEDMTYKGPIDKFMTDGQRREIADLAKLKPGDVLYFISDAKDAAPGLAGQIRTEVAKRLNLIREDTFAFCFITDYPMYELNGETGRVDFTHNPFSMPQGELEALLSKDPLDILADQYDIVCNGVELSSGAVRNHRPEVMVKAFEIAGYSEEDVKEKFGALYHAFQFGAPPHAGMAPGVDRIVMLLSGDENIREVIAFPLNSNAQNLMLDAPGEVSEQQLREAHIRIRKGNTD